MEVIIQPTDESAAALVARIVAHDLRANPHLVLGLAQPAPAGKPIKLTFEIDGNFLYRPEGSNYWQLGIWPWYPTPQKQEQSFTYHSLLKVKKPFCPGVNDTGVAGSLMTSVPPASAGMS